MRSSRDRNAVDVARSRQVTEALNATIPRVVAAAGGAQVASRMLLTAASCAVVLGLLAAIFGSTLSRQPAALAAVLVAFSLLVGTMLVALVIGLRAKRATAQVAQAVRERGDGALVRVVNRQVHVR